MVSFVYLSVERLFNKFHGINCHPKLGAKLLDRFFHWRRQVSPPVNSLPGCLCWSASAVLQPTQQQEP